MAPQEKINETKQNIIQWNCWGIKPNYEEIKCIMTNYNPNIICLQETLLNETDNITLKGYDTYNQTNRSARDNQPTGGTSIIIKNQIPHAVLPLQTNLQAIALKASLHRTITICSIYIPPKHKLNWKLDGTTPYLHHTNGGTLMPTVKCGDAMTPI